MQQRWKRDEKIMPCNFLSTWLSASLRDRTCSVQYCLKVLVHLPRCAKVKPQFWAVVLPRFFSVNLSKNPSFTLVFCSWKNHGKNRISFVLKFVNDSRWDIMLQWFKHDTFHMLHNSKFRKKLALNAVVIKGSFLEQLQLEVWRKRVQKSFLNHHFVSELQRKQNY